MPNVTRITSNGTFYTANTIDEISYNPSVAFGKNLFRSSQAYGTGFWIPQTTTVIDNFILGPDEKTFASKIIGNAGVTTRKSIYQGVTLQANVKYTFSVYVKEAGFSNIMLWFDSTPPGYLEEGPYYGAGDLINIINGTKTINNGQTNPIINVGNGWYRVSVSATPRWALSVNFNFSLGDANGNGTKVGDGFSGVYLWNPQLEIGTVATDPVLTNSSGFPVSNVIFKTTNIGNYYARSYIDEMSYNKNVPAKNLAYPANLALWSKGWDFDPPAITITDETVAPDGTTTAVKWEQARQSGQLSTPFNNPRYKAGVPYTFSVYAKARSPSIQFSILLYAFAYAGQTSPNVSAAFTLTPTSATLSGSTNLVDSYGIVPVDNGWYRCWMTSTCRIANNNQGHQFIRYATSNTSAYFWGYQIEEGTVPTDYVQTTNTGTIATNFVKRDTANGVSMVSSEFDERNGVLDQVVDSSLIVNLDAAKLESYPGSGTTWFDTTPNKLNATPAGGVTTPPTWEYITNSFAYRRNNAVQSLVLPTSPLLSTPSFTMEVWVKQIAFNPNDHYTNALLSREIYLTAGFRCGVTGDGRPVFWTDQSGGNFSLVSSIFTTINRFYQLSITYNVDQKVCSMYVNGALAGTQRNAICLIPPVTPYVIALGAASAGGTNDQIGNIGNFMYYNRPLSASEVLQNYSAIRGRYGI